MSKKSVQSLILQMIRVNQAGEYGAKRIYQGQLSQTKDKDQRALLTHMANQEDVHLSYFNEKMVEYGATPTALHPFWHIGGYLMGAVTAKLDPKLAHACTMAVEDVIDKHYAEQIQHLKFFPEYADFKDAISHFRDEEIEHHDIAEQNGGDMHPASPVIKKIVGGITKAAIFLSKKI